jgi:hypothetical protein
MDSENEQPEKEGGSEPEPQPRPAVVSVKVEAKDYGAVEYGETTENTIRTNLGGARSHNDRES